MRWLGLAALLSAAAALDILHGGQPQVKLAAAELRRYLTLASPAAPLPALLPATPQALAAATGPTLLLLTHAEAAALGVATPAGAGAEAALSVATPTGAAAALSVASPAGAASYTLSAPRENLTQLIGEDAQSVLYAAYTYLEVLGFTFTSFGPTIPAPAALLRRGSLLLPPGFSQTDTPVFTTRGLQPFHDFAEGPDWWSEDEHKRVIECILSMKGNLIGFHTYPLQEPAVWVGLKEQVLPGGNVTGGSYSTRWATTLEEGQAWGYNAFPTSTMGYGASQVYEHDCFGHPSVSGDALLCPSPKTPEDNDELFNRVGLLWRAAFAHAKALGVQTILGTEIPLSMPPAPAPPAPPAGATLPLQHWYSATRNDHFVTTTDCAQCVGLYDFVGVTGWVFAGNEPGSTPICTYASTLPNGQIDNRLAPCGNSTGVRIEGYVPAPGTAGTLPLAQYINAQGHHWAVWPALIPNATAAGFMPMAAAPLIGSVFASGPPVPGLPNATAFYEGIFTRLVELLGSNLTYYWGWTPENWEWDKVPITSPLIQDAVTDMHAMQAAHDVVGPPFGLASCGWTVGPLGARWYYDTVLPNTTIISSIDMDVGNTPVDPAYANITHRPSALKWIIPWSEDDPGLTAPELWVNRSLLHARDGAAYGVGGILSIHWRTRMTSPQIGSAHAVAWNLSLTSQDYWGSWALGQFGDPAVAAAMAAILTSMDSFAMPRPVEWSGPGGMQPGCTPAQQYAFVDAIVAQRPALLAALAAQPPTATLAHLEAFDYWAGQFVYMQQIPVFTCDWKAVRLALAAAVSLC